MTESKSGNAAKKTRLKGACFLSALFYLAMASAQAEKGSNKGLTPPAVQKASTPKGNSKSAAKKSPASDSRQAVDLLESIFERLRSVPQLAVTRSKQTLAYRVYGNNGNVLQGTVDPLLIKPKDLSRLSSRLKKMSDANVIAAAPSGPAAATVRSAPMITNSSGIWERSQMPQLASEPSQATDDFSSAKTAYAQDKVKSYAGTKGILIADGNEPDNTLIASQPLIREFGGPAPNSLDGSAATPAAAPLRSAPSLSGGGGLPGSGGYVGTLTNGRKKGSQARLSQSGQSDTLSFEGRGKDQAASLTGATNGAVGPFPSGARWAYSPNVYKVEQPNINPAMQNLQQTLAGKNLAKNLPRANAEARQVQKALSDAKLLGPDLVKTGALDPGLQTISVSNGPIIKDARQSSMGLDVALLPVTKFMGIPQIRLGTSETEALSVANQIGFVSKESIKGWSVWSISKGKGKQPSLQFFLRAGNLDAIRVLDPIFWDTEHGLTVGTGLPEVKRQLGEPAFIISNDTSPSAQNYVYPISQVDFQLRRSVDDDVPKIVSILLFSVK